MNGQNSVSFKEMLSVARDLGQQAGKGKDVQIKFLLKVAEAAFQGSLDREKDKHGPDRDDAVVISEEYVKAQTGSVIFDAKAPNQRKTISCTRTMIKLGMWPKGGVGEPLGTLNQLISIRQNLRKDPANAKKLEDAANTALRYARVQLQRDQLVSQEELKGFCFKRERNYKGLAEMYESTRKAWRAVIDGKASHGTVQSDSEFAMAIVSACTDGLIEIAEANKPQAQEAQEAQELAPEQANT